MFTALRLTQKNFASCAVHQKNGEDVSRQVGKSNVETFPIDWGADTRRLKWDS